MANNKRVLFLTRELTIALTRSDSQEEREESIEFLTKDIQVDLDGMTFRYACKRRYLSVYSKWIIGDRR